MGIRQMTGDVLGKLADWMKPSGTDAETTGSQTGGQTVGMDDGVSEYDRANAYALYRDIRRLPTVALARAVAVAPIIAADWAVEADDDAPAGMADLVEDVFTNQRRELLEPALFFGYLDYGWCPFEKIWTERDGAYVIRKFKPLLHDLTSIVVRSDNGAFLGFAQGDTRLALPDTLLFSWRVEGTNWYGESIYSGLHRHGLFDAWLDANASAGRYDVKLAGRIIVCRHPQGRSRIRGVEKDNDQVARDLLSDVKGSAGVVLPSTPQTIGAETTDAWSLEMLESGGSGQPGFVARLKYLDAQLVRALVMPERAVLEGSTGTRADADAHGDVGLTVAELAHEQATTIVNRHAVRAVLEYNFGPSQRDKARLVAAPLVDEKRRAMSEVYAAILANPAGALEEFEALDTSAMRQTIGLPEKTGGDYATEGMDPNAPEADAVAAIYDTIAGE